MKTPKNAPAEVKRVITEFNHFLDNLTIDQIGHEIYGDMKDHLNFLKNEQFSAYYSSYDNEWFVGNAFENDFPCGIFSNGKWFYRNSWDGRDAEIKGGAMELIADLKCSITA